MIGEKCQGQLFVSSCSIWLTSASPCPGALYLHTPDLLQYYFRLSVILLDTFMLPFSHRCEIGGVQIIMHILEMKQIRPSYIKEFVLSQKINLTVPKSPVTSLTPDLAPVPVVTLLAFKLH